MKKMLLALFMVVFVWGCGGDDSSDYGGDIILYGMGHYNDYNLKMNESVDFPIDLISIAATPVRAQSCFISLPNDSYKAYATFVQSILQDTNVRFKISCVQGIGKMTCAGVDIPLTIDSSNNYYNFTNIKTTCNLESGTISRTHQLRWQN